LIISIEGQYFVVDSLNFAVIGMESEVFTNPIY